MNVRKASRSRRTTADAACPLWVVNEHSISPTAAIHDRQIQPTTE
jgi:hypothetical protein